jgi:hypothetical protein
MISLEDNVVDAIEKTAGLRSLVRSVDEATIPMAVKHLNKQNPAEKKSTSSKFLYWLQKNMVQSKLNRRSRRRSRRLKSHPAIGGEFSLRRS